MCNDDSEKQQNTDSPDTEQEQEKKKTRPTEGAPGMGAEAGEVQGMTGDAAGNVDEERRLNAGTSGGGGASVQPTDKVISPQDEDKKKDNHPNSEQKR